MKTAVNESEYTIEDLSRDVEAIVDGEFDQSVITDSLQPLLSRFLAKGSIPEEYCGSMPGVDLTEDLEYFNRVNMLYRGRNERFVIISATWPPGGRTGPHDHNGTWVVEGVYRNRMATMKYVREDDGSVPGHAQLKPVFDGEIPQGQVTHVMHPDDDIHDYWNPTDKPSVTIHIYGADPSKETTNFYDAAAGTYAPVTNSFPYDNEV